MIYDCGHVLLSEFSTKLTHTINIVQPSQQQLSSCSIFITRNSEHSNTSDVCKDTFLCIRWFKPTDS